MHSPKRPDPAQQVLQSALAPFLPKGDGPLPEFAPVFAILEKANVPVTTSGDNEGVVVFAHPDQRGLCVRWQDAPDHPLDWIAATEKLQGAASALRFEGFEVERVSPSREDVVYRVSNAQGLASDPTLRLEEERLEPVSASEATSVVDLVSETSAAHLHSAAWFDQAFEGIEVPVDLRGATEQLCRTYGIAGLSDPAYIANLLAMKLGRGDGQGAFTPTSAPRAAAEMPQDAPEAASATPAPWSPDEALLARLVPLETALGRLEPGSTHGLQLTWGPEGATKSRPVNHLEALGIAKAFDMEAWGFKLPVGTNVVLRAFALSGSPTVRPGAEGTIVEVGRFDQEGYSYKIRWKEPRRTTFETHAQLLKGYSVDLASSFTAAKVPLDDTEAHSWFERDRAHVELRHSITGQTIVEWWDQDVHQAIEDGILDLDALRYSAHDHAEKLNLLAASRFYQGYQISVAPGAKDWARVFDEEEAQDLDLEASKQAFIAFITEQLQERFQGAEIMVNTSAEADTQIHALSPEGKHAPSFTGPIKSLFTDALLDEPGLWSMPSKAQRVADAEEMEPPAFSARRKDLTMALMRLQMGVERAEKPGVEGFKEITRDLGSLLQRPLMLIGSEEEGRVVGAHLNQMLLVAADPSQVLPEGFTSEARLALVEGISHCEREVVRLLLDTLALEDYEGHVWSAPRKHLAFALRTHEGRG